LILQLVKTTARKDLQPFVNHAIHNLTAMAKLKHLDDSHLFALTGGDGPLRVEILQTFLVSARDSLAQLKEAQTGDAWRRVAHKLKGLAASVGAQVLADAAARASVGTPDAELMAVIEIEFGLLVGAIGAPA
jgi:hypothetical protein